MLFAITLVQSTILALTQVQLLEIVCPALMIVSHASTKQHALFVNSE